MFGKQKIWYDIVRSKKRKKIELVVLENGKVKVLAPSGKSSHQIHLLVKSRSRWIFQQQLRLREHKDKKLTTYYDGSTLPYLGRQYLLRIIDGENDATESFSFSGGKFIIKAKRNDPKIIKALYEKWLENRAASVLERKVNEYSSVLKIDRDKLRINIKSQRNRLGSLGRKLTINFNKDLIRLPPKIIDYVVVHELCHTKVPNHSPAYWHIVGLVIPDYKKSKEWLRLNKQVLGSIRQYPYPAKSKW